MGVLWLLQLYFLNQVDQTPFNSIVPTFFIQHFPITEDLPPFVFLVLPLLLFSLPFYLIFNFTISLVLSFPQLLNLFPSSSFCQISFYLFPFCPFQKNHNFHPIPLLIWDANHLTQHQISTFLFPIPAEELYLRTFLFSFLPYAQSMLFPLIKF